MHRVPRICPASPALPLGLSLLLSNRIEFGGVCAGSMIGVPRLHPKDVAVTFTIKDNKKSSRHRRQGTSKGPGRLSSDGTNTGERDGWPGRHEKHGSNRQEQGKPERKGRQERTPTKTHAGSPRSVQDSKSAKNTRIADPNHSRSGEHATLDGARVSPATPATLALGRNAPKHAVSGSTMRSPTVGPQRPRSAGAVAASAYAWNVSTRSRGGGGPPFLKPAAREEKPDGVDGGRPARKSSGCANGTAACRVFCWTDEKTAGRRPPPLGRTCVPLSKSAKSMGRARHDDLEEGMEENIPWNRSCSCGDLALGLIDKDMERAARDLNVTEEKRTKEQGFPSRTVHFRRGKARASSRPTTGTSAKLLLTLRPAGDKKSGPPPHGRVDGNHRRRRHKQSPEEATPAGDALIRTGENAISGRMQAYTRACHHAATRRGNAWNGSTRIDDDDLPPDALLRKHPGWDVAGRGREAGVRVCKQGGFFYGGSTARTITTRTSSSVVRSSDTL